jgi:hypothetical protein
MALMAARDEAICLDAACPIHLRASQIDYPYQKVRNTPALPTIYLCRAK